MNKSVKTSFANCPSCAARIYFHTRPKLGDIVVCHECEDNLEVVRLNPIKLDWSLLEDDETWFDDDFDEEFDDDDFDEDYEED